MRAAGVRAEVRVWKRDNLLQQLRNRSRDLFLTSWGNSSLEPLGILPVLFRSDGYGNYFGFEDEQADRLLTEAERTMDADDRAAKYREVQQILHREAPTCFHFALEELCGVADRVAGFQARSDGMLPMHDVSLKT
jgi:peptide/nickel transport system substrate-binding protein